jgi:hypothetical protein
VHIGGAALPKPETLNLSSANAASPEHLFPPSLACGIEKQEG